MDFVNIINSIKESVIKESPDTLFQLFSYDGLGLNEMVSLEGFKNDSEKEKVSEALRTHIGIEQPQFVISVCIGLFNPIQFSKKKKDKREVLIIVIENNEGVYEIQNFYINRSKKKILGLSPAWNYDKATIEANNFTMAGVLCGWYQSLEEIYEYIRQGQIKASREGFSYN